MVGVLTDGRIDAPDGIGRYTRCTIAALRSVVGIPVPGDGIRLDVLAPTGTPRYGSAEADELLDTARRVGADVIHLFDYRIPWPDPGIPLVVTVHDVVRLRDPGLCYPDAAFAARFGADDLAAMRRAVAELRALTPPAPAARAHPASVHEEYYGLMMAHLAATAHRIVVPTETVAGQFRAAVRADAPVLVSSWGSDHLLGAPAPPERVPQVPDGFVLYVGLARAHKRIGAVLDAYARTASRRRGVPLVLVGNDFAPGGPGAALVAGHPVAAEAVLLGAVDDSVLQSLYLRAGALVSLSASEGFGFPPLEALAVGTAVVAADIPTYRELLGTAARLVDPDDLAGTARAIDESVTAGPPPAAREVAPRPWATHARTLLDLYREAVRDRPTRGS
ncbi:glycosyltransferase [Micromonospora sp. WMMD1102]|uniref:glycosyltransferase n=1 Tax=Micromonospora sp. WMMD1102 TaxID=3016105 RepID=UPI00241586ED|nr:glycosyltransferase [Micromonospora sp. WMMD1102]MDG4786766.1 glycosyltransferase [Micromonospora sp. WMMD1102]